jgi:predicted phosphate transport protein (TIGR00153 family)
LSELLKWFEKRRQTKALTMMQQHLAMTVTIVEDLERAAKAWVNNDEKELKVCADRISKAEKEADNLRREVMNELAGGELPAADREDLMHLMKRVDMVADWSQESTRIIKALPIAEVPDNLRKACIEMVEGVKECVFALRKSISRIAEKPEEALKSADEVERQEEKVDDLHEKARALLATETIKSAGIAVLINQLLEAFEMAADWCEDTCDQIRIIVVRR